MWSGSFPTSSCSSLLSSSIEGTPQNCFTKSGVKTNMSLRRGYWSYNKGDRDIGREKNMLDLLRER